MGVEHRFDLGHVGRVQRELDAEKRRRLQLDPAAPALARFGENRPTNARLRADAVDVGANGGRPVRVGAAQAEFHACGDIGGGPVAPNGLRSSPPARS